MLHAGLGNAVGQDKRVEARCPGGPHEGDPNTTIFVLSTMRAGTNSVLGEEVDDGDIHLFRGRGKGSKHPSSGSGIVSLSGNLASTGLVTFLLQPSDKFEDEKRTEHSGTEGVFVVEGSVELQFSDRVITLRQGDYIQFPGHLTRQVRRTSPQATVLIVVSDS